MPLKRTNQLPSSKTPDRARRRYLVFAVGEMMYAVDIRRVRQCLRATAHPEAEIVIQGQPYPRVDARALLGLPPLPASNRMILAAETEATRAALVVDAVVALTAIEDQAILPLPVALDGVEREWFEGVASLQTGLTALVRLDALLSPRFDPEPVAPDLALAGSR